MSNYGPRIEPEFWRDRRIQTLRQGTDRDRRALLMLLEFRSHCMATESDGMISEIEFRAASTDPDPMDLAARLGELGLIDNLGNGQWCIDWAQQLKAEQIVKERTDKADWDRHMHGNHSACGNHKPQGRGKRGYDCHRNGDYERWLEEHPNLGMRLGDLEGNRLGDPSRFSRLDSTRPDSTEAVFVGERVEKVDMASPDRPATSASASGPATVSPSSDEGTAHQNNPDEPTALGNNPDAVTALDNELVTGCWYRIELTEESIGMPFTMADLREALPRAQATLKNRLEMVPQTLTIKPRNRTVEIRLSKHWWNVNAKDDAMTDAEAGQLFATKSVLLDWVRGDLRDDGIEMQFDPKGYIYPITVEVPYGMDAEEFVDVLSAKIRENADYCFSHVDGKMLVAVEEEDQSRSPVKIAGDPSE